MKKDISFYFLLNNHGQTGGRKKEKNGWVEWGQRGEVEKEKQ